MHIKHAIIPAAGLGTRFLPFTKATPKELLPLLHHSAIEYIVQEGVDAGITDFYLITNEHKPTLAHYFRPTEQGQPALVAKKNDPLLASVNHLIAEARFHYVNQQEPLGLGHAIFTAQKYIGDNHCAVLLPDDLVFHRQTALAQLLDVARAYNGTVLAVQEVAPEQVHQYGIIAIKREVSSGIFELADLIEKPALHDAPSLFGIIGRYILSPHIFASLAVTEPNAGNEIQLTDAIRHMLHRGEPVLACMVKGNRYDIGNPLGWLSANIDLGLRIPEYAATIRRMVHRSY